jgi:hypothetical protein
VTVPVQSPSERRAREGHGVLEMHFLRVARGDCTIIRHRSGRLTMVDINTESPPTGCVTPLDYLDAHFPGDTLHRYVQAHQDLEHMRGLTELLTRRKVRYVWFPGQSTSWPHAETAQDKMDLATYARLIGEKVAGVQVVAPVAGQDLDTLDRYRFEGLSVVMPTRDLAALCRVAQGVPPASYILAWDHGGVRVLLAGEVQQGVWKAALRGRTESLACTILQASHAIDDCNFDHSSKPYGIAISTMGPSHVVLSSDPKCEAEAMQAYQARGANVISLNQAAAVILRISGTGEITFECRPAG